MSTALRITGAIDRCDPDPTAPNDLSRRFIGSVTAQWTGDGPETRSAAIIKVATGRGCGDLKWGQHMLQLAWLGDPPPVEVAQAVYDRILDGGPGKRSLSASLIGQQRSEAQPSYRMARA